MTGKKKLGGASSTQVSGKAQENYERLKTIIVFLDNLQEIFDFSEQKPIKALGWIDEVDLEELQEEEKKINLHLIHLYMIDIYKSEICNKLINFCSRVENSSNLFQKFRTLYQKFMIYKNEYKQSFRHIFNVARIPFHDESLRDKINSEFQRDDEESIKKVLEELFGQEERIVSNYFRDQIKGEFDKNPKNLFESMVFIKKICFYLKYIPYFLETYINEIEKIKNTMNTMTESDKAALKVLCSIISLNLLKLSEKLAQLQKSLIIYIKEINGYLYKEDRDFIIELTKKGKDLRNRFLNTAIDIIGNVNDELFKLLTEFITTTKEELLTKLKSFKDIDGMSLGEVGQTILSVGSVMPGHTTKLEKSVKGYITGLDAFKKYLKFDLDGPAEGLLAEMKNYLKKQFQESVVTPMVVNTAMSAPKSIHKALMKPLNVQEKQELQKRLLDSALMNH